MCTKAYTNPVNGRHYIELDRKPCYAIQKRINDELAAQDDNRRLYRRLPSVQDQMRLLALHMEALEFWQNLNPTDYCMDNRGWIDWYRDIHRREVSKMADQFGFKVELQVIVEQLPMVQRSVRQQIAKVRV